MVEVQKDLNAVVFVDPLIALGYLGRKVVRGGFVPLDGDVEHVVAVADVGFALTFDRVGAHLEDALVELGERFHLLPRRVFQHAVDLGGLPQPGRAEQQAEFGEQVQPFLGLAVVVVEAAQFVVDVLAVGHQLPGRQEHGFGAVQIGFQFETARLAGVLLGDYLQPLQDFQAQGIGPHLPGHRHQLCGEALPLRLAQLTGADAHVGPAADVLHAHDLQGDEDLQEHVVVCFGVEALDEGSGGLALAQVAEFGGHPLAHVLVRVFEAGDQGLEDAPVFLPDVELEEGLGHLDARSRGVGAVLEGGDQRLDGRTFGQGQPHPGGFSFLGVAFDQALDFPVNGVGAGQQGQAGWQDQVEKGCSHGRNPLNGTLHHFTS